MTDRFRRLLAAKGWKLADDANVNVAVPGERALAVYARLVRGLPDAAVDGRAYAVLELAVPSLEMHLTAFSDFTTYADTMSNCFRLVVLNWFLGKRPSHETLTFDGERSQSRGYKPDVAEKARADGVTYVPWLTFAIHGCDPTDAGQNEFPLFHRTDVREWVADKNRDVVVVDGDFYVNLAVTGQPSAMRDTCGEC